MATTTDATRLPDRLEQLSRRDARHERMFHWLLKGCALLVLAALLGAAGATLWGGRDAFATFGWHFLVSDAWDPGNDVYGALVPVYGTLVTSLIALLIAVPVSFGIAVYLSEVAPNWLRAPVASAIELLAGIPSIIYGMWGLFIFAPFFADHIKPWLTNNLGNQPDDGKLSWVAAHVPFVGKLFGSDYPFGASVLVAGIVLAIMIIPFISSVMREVFLTVPTRLKESAYALGSTKWEVVWDIVLPYTRTAVVGGVFLGFGRALGETMAVAYLVGNSVQFTASLLEPSTTIAALIANDFNESTGLHRSSLLLLGFVLFIVTFIVLAAARLMLLRLSRKEGN